MLTFLTNPINRFRRGMQRQGFFSTLHQLARNTFNRRFRARLCVWVWNYGEPLIEPPLGVEVVRFGSEAVVPLSVIEQVLERDNETFVARMKDEFADSGVLWVAMIDGQVAGYQWSQPGHVVKDWHFELWERDVLIFSTVTFHDFRGQGVAKAIMAHICREEVSEGGRACADCMVWNTPAVRFIQNTGFTKVAERKPLPDHPD